MRTDEFIQAIKKNDNPTIHGLLEKEPKLAETKDSDGVSAIFLALYRGNKQAAEEVASRKSNLDVFEAAALGNQPRLKSLVEHDRSAALSCSPDGFTALALAAYLGKKDSVEYLINNGADINAVAKNETGFTALTGAVSQNHNEVAKILVERGAKVNYDYEGGFTPLMHAAHAGNLELVKLLLAHGADVNAKNSEGKTPLMFANEKGHASVVEQLRKHGAV